MAHTNRREEKKINKQTKVSMEMRISIKHKRVPIVTQLNQKQKSHKFLIKMSLEQTYFVKYEIRCIIVIVVFTL